MNAKLNKLSKNVILAHANCYFKPYDFNHRNKSFDKSAHNQLIAGLADFYAIGRFPTNNGEILSNGCEYNRRGV